MNDKRWMKVIIPHKTIDFFVFYCKIIHLNHKNMPEFDSTIQEIDPGDVIEEGPDDGGENDFREDAKTARTVRGAVDSTLQLYKISKPLIYSPEKTPISRKIIHCDTGSGYRMTAASDKGVNYKDHNEDCIFIHPEKDLVVVIDGVGSGTEGKIAAQWVAVGFSDYPENPEEAVNAAMGYMKRDRINSSTDGACFASARILSDNGKRYVDIAKAGDVKVLIFDENYKLVWKTLDNSHVQNEINAGRMTYDEALYHPNSNIVIKCISSDKCSIDRLALEVKAGYKVMLGSDGFFANITPEETEELISGKGYSSEQIITLLSNYTAERMQNADSILATTNEIGGRQKFGMFSDGFLTTPNPDNRSMVIVEIPR
jgi:protein phosphatase